MPQVAICEVQVFQLAGRQNHQVNSWHHSFIPGQGSICPFSKFEIPRIGQRLVQMLQDGAPAAPEAPAVTTTTTATAPVQEVQYTNKRFLDTNVYKSIWGPLRNYS